MTKPKIPKELDARWGSHVFPTSQSGQNMASLPKRLGFMAEAMVSAKVGPQARFFTRERVDEIVLLLREAEKWIVEGR